MTLTYDLSLPNNQHGLGLEWDASKTIGWLLDGEVVNLTKNQHLKIQEEMRNSHRKMKRSPDESHTQTH